MKKFILLLLGVVIFVSPIFADGDGDGDGGDSNWGTIIPIIPVPDGGGDGDGNGTGNDDGGDGNGNDSGIPTLPSPGVPKPTSLGYYANIDATYSMGAVHLNFMVDMGSAFVSIYNRTTGEQWMDMVDASRSATIDIDTDNRAGSYLIVIETELAGSYYGYFVL